MARNCIALNCKESSRKRSSVKFHVFPVDNERRQKWIKAVNRDNFNPGKQASLCSKHFADKCFIFSANNRRMLRRDAVPTIFNLQTVDADLNLHQLHSAPTEQEFNISKTSLETSNFDQKKDKSSPRSSSSTLTASETTFEMAQVKQKKRQKLYKKQRKARRNWRIVKRLILRQKIRIKNMHQKTRRLQFRINTLVAMMNELKSKHNQ